MWGFACWWLASASRVPEMTLSRPVKVGWWRTQRSMRGRIPARATLQEEAAEGVWSTPLRRALRAPTAARAWMSAAWAELEEAPRSEREALASTRVPAEPLLEAEAVQPRAELLQAELLQAELLQAELPRAELLQAERRAKALEARRPAALQGERATQGTRWKRASTPMRRTGRTSLVSPPTVRARSAFRIEEDALRFARRGPVPAYRGRSAARRRASI